MTLKDFQEDYLSMFKEDFANIIYEIVKDWKEISISPYSHSIYNSNDIDWNYKPEYSYRISNHWSFISKDELHCELEDDNENLKNKWLLCQYVNGKYRVIKNITEEWEKIKGE